jgi:hypothetical protein
MVPVTNTLSLYHRVLVRFGPSRQTTTFPPHSSSGYVIKGDRQVKRSVVNGLLFFFKEPAFSEPAWWHSDKTGGRAYLFHSLEMSTPPPEAISRAVTPHASSRVVSTVSLLLQPLVDAPRIDCPRLEVAALETPGFLRAWLRRVLGLPTTTPLYLYFSRTIPLDADESFGSLLAAFGPAPLSISYATRRIM